MDRRRAAGALLALAACLACVAAAPTASNQTALDLYDADSAEGCYYNFQRYGESDRIMTNEPCLNCTCHNRMLMCYLRVCPFTKPIGQDCSVEKRADQCCPIVTCPDVPVDLLTSTPTTSPAEYGTTGVGHLDKYGCSIHGKYFPEGAKVPPSPNKPCEHCYCIRNMTTCVMQECTLHVDGCTPIYHKEVCCPIRYSCDHQDDEVPMLDDMTTTVRPTPGFLLTTTTVASVTQIPQECVHDDQIFPDGALIKTEKACEHCYCMKGDIVCVVQECGTPMENEGKNCTSLAPREGQCCPDTYICEGDEVQTELPTEIPTEAATEEQKKATTEVPTEEATEVQKEAPTEIQTEGATETQKEYSTEEPKEPSTQVPKEDVTEALKEVVTEIPKEDVTEAQKEVVTEIPKEDVTEAQKEVVTEIPEEAVTKVPTEDESDVQKEEVTEIPTDTAAEVQKEASTEAPIEETTEKQKEYSTQEPKEAPTQLPTEEVTELEKEPVTEVIKEATKLPTGEVTEEQKETATEMPKEAAIDSTTDAATQAAPEAAVESVSETSTEGSGETATDSASDGTPESVTQTIKEAVTDKVTYATSEAATEVSTQPPSEVAPDEPIEEPTTFIPPRRTSVEGSGYRNEPDEIFTESPFLETEGSGDEEKPEKPSDSEDTSVPIEETTSPVRDIESEFTTAKDISTYSSSSAETPTSYTEQATTEPDKGENTVPNDEILPSIFDVTPSEALVTSEAPVTTHSSEEITPPIDKSTENTSEDKQSAVTTPEAFATAFTEKDTLATEPAFESEKVTEAPTESASKKEPEEMLTEKPDDTEMVASTTEKEELDIQTTVSFDEKESKSTTVQLPDMPAGVDTTKQEEATTETVQEYTTPENKIKDQDIYTTVQPEIEESKTTTIRADPIENEIHEEHNLTPGVIPGEGNCLVDGITYNNDSVVPVSQKCQSSCRCMSSIVKCEEIMCSPQPENMGNCQAVYESEKTCCPYYTCDQAKETPPLKPHSQMSGTELPITQGDCDGEICNKQDETLPTEVSPQCTSGDCSNETDNKNTELCGTTGCADQQEPVLMPTKEEGVIQPEICTDGKCISPPKDCTGDSCQLPTRKDCGNDELCDVSPQEACEGRNCGVDTTPVKESSVPAQESTHGCANPEDCKSSPSEITTPTCEGEECTLIKQDCSSGKCESIPVEVPTTPDEQQQEACSDESSCKKTDQSQEPQPECTDEACIKKDVTDIEDKPSQVCTDDSCVQQATVAPSSDVGPLSTKLPESVDTTELPVAIDTEIEKEVIPDVPVTEFVETTAQPVTDILETTIATQETSSEEPDIVEISTKTPEITYIEPQEITTAIPNVTNLQEAQETEKSTTVTEPQKIEQPQTEPSVSDLPESDSTMKIQVEITTAAAMLEEEKPEDVTHKQDIVTEAPVESTSLETRIDTTNAPIMETSMPVKDDEQTTELAITQSPLVTEREEINTVMPEALPTESSKEPEESTVTKSQEKEPSMAEEPATTEVLPGSSVTESQSDFVTTRDDNVVVEISKAPEDEYVTKTPEQATEISEAVTEAKTEPPIQDELTTKPQIIETTMEPFSNEEVTSTEVTGHMEPQQTITDLPVVPIMDEKDNTESPEMYTKYVTTAAPEQIHTSTETPESPTTEIHDVYTKVSEMPMSEEQVKHTVVPETPVTESQDDESTILEQERTTPSVYTVTEPQAVTDGLREGAVTEKELSSSERPVTESLETETRAPEISPSEGQEQITEQPATESQEVLEEKITEQPESSVTEGPEITTKVPEEQEVVTYVPTTPVNEQENVVTEVTKAPASEEKEKPTETPISSAAEAETKSPEMPTESDSSIKEPTQPQTTTDVEHFEHEDEKATESPAMLPQIPEKQDITTESLEIATTEPQKAGTDVPEIVIPQEADKQTEIPEPVTETQEVVTEGAVEQPSVEQDSPVTQQDENVTEASKIPEEEVKYTTETKEFVTKAPKDATEVPEAVEQQTTVKIETKLPEYEINTMAPDEQDNQTKVPFAPVTEPQQISTSPIEQQDDKQDDEEQKRTEIPETAAKEPQDAFTTTTAPLSVQDTQTDAPEAAVTDKQDAITQLPEIYTESPEKQTETPESPATEFQEVAATTKVIPTVTTQPELASGEPESPITEPQEKGTERPEPSMPEEQEVYTNAPESAVTVSQDTGSTQAVVPTTHFDETSTETPEAAVQEDKDIQTMVPESHVTEPQQISTEAPAPQDIHTEAPASPITEPQEAFTNVPVVIVPEEQPTLSPAAQEPATIAPEIPVQEDSETKTPVEQSQESAVTEEPVILEEKVTEIPEGDITKPQDIITDYPAPVVTEKQDGEIPVTESQKLSTSAYEENIGATEQSIPQTSQPKLEYSETTPYLVELEEHTHKIEVETSTTISEDISEPQATEAYEKPEEPSTEIEKDTESPLTTEKSIEVSSVTPVTDTPATLQESVPTEPELSTSSPQEQSTSKTDIDGTRKTTVSSEEVEEKIPEEAVPSPMLPVTEKEAEATVQPEAETEKYTTAQPTEKPMEATSSQEVSSEEDSIPVRTTTVKSTDETTTLAPIYKATTLEPKPTELPSPISQETAKPTSSEEAPSEEEEAGQIPPSGTGYGQEPDYAEEDQAFGPGTCRYGGKVYVSAQQIPRDDPCDFCFCFRSDIICLQQSCPPPIHGCHEEPIQGFCCPRYECPVSMATTLNVTTTTTTTTTTLPPHFLTHAYHGAAQKRGCMIKGHTYKVGEVVRATSGPCLHCTCGGDGQMKCDPKVCTPEPMLRQMIAAAVSAKRRR